MISQADIIRTLVNKNCTDELVMSTALSPNCTPAKLLEVLTETERWDLALDVSMKIGLDVSSLCKSWAMRCLKNRDFKTARDKFRQCFKRNRLPGNRAIVPSHNEVLFDILSALSKMDEHPIPLNEQIQSIKSGLYKRSDDDINSETNFCTPSQSMLNKPTIHSECLYYLKEYGCTTDMIKFNLINTIWDQAIELLLTNCDQINIEKFFIPHVVQYTSRIGKFGTIVTTLKQCDPDLSKSEKYFKSIYKYCQRYRRYNTLHQVQVSIGDHIAAAHTQLKYFFLANPMKNYRELNHRVPSLISAQTNYEAYLKKQIEYQTDDLQPPGEHHSRPGGGFFATMPINEVERAIELLKLQSELTVSFALNEVTGCIHELDLFFGPNNQIGHVPESRKPIDPNVADVNHQPRDGGDRDLPVTIFDPDQLRQTYLAALALIYYDTSCSEYISESGLSMALRIIEISSLDKIKVFKTAMRIVIEDESCDIMETASLLLQRLRQEFLRDPSSFEHYLKSRLLTSPRLALAPDEDEHLSSSSSSLSSASLLLSGSLPPQASKSSPITRCPPFAASVGGSQASKQQQVAALASGDKMIGPGAAARGPRHPQSVGRPDKLSSAAKLGTTSSSGVSSSKSCPWEQAQRNKQSSETVAQQQLVPPPPRPNQAGTSAGSVVEAATAACGVSPKRQALPAQQVDQNNIDTTSRTGSASRRLSHQPQSSQAQIKPPARRDSSHVQIQAKPGERPRDLQQQQQHQLLLLQQLAGKTATSNLSASELARTICDHVIRDSIERCREPDYKMELAKLLSGEAKIELYIELGKLSNAQQLACTMNRPDYVANIIEAATRLNQKHVRSVCELWLAKHETGSKSLGKH